MQCIPGSYMSSCMSAAYLDREEFHSISPPTWCVQATASGRGWAVGTSTSPPGGRHDQGQAGYATSRRHGGPHPGRQGEPQQIRPPGWQTTSCNVAISGGEACLSVQPGIAVESCKLLDQRHCCLYCPCGWVNEARVEKRNQGWLSPGICLVRIV